MLIDHLLISRSWALDGVQPPVVEATGDHGSLRLWVDDGDRPVHSCKAGELPWRSMPRMFWKQRRSNESGDGERGFKDAELMDNNFPMAFGFAKHRMCAKKPKVRYCRDMYDSAQRHHSNKS